MTASGSVFPQDDVRYFEIPNDLAVTRIRFDYSPQIAGDAGWQWTPASPDIQTPTGPIPECVKIVFQNYIISVGWVETGQAIYVYPVATFPDEPYPFAVELANLREVLAARPNVPDHALPMLPTVTASQIFRSQVEYLDFPNGSGIRFITSAGLDVSPLSDEGLFYTYQGLTNDGAYYIAAMFPIKSPVLPDNTVQMTTEQYNEFVANYDSYLADTVQQLDELSADDFRPRLDAIDHVFASLEITPPLATIFTPEGVETETATYGDISFSYDTDLASRIEVDAFGPILDPDGQTMYGSQPGYTLFSVYGYPIIRPNSRAMIRIARVEDFPATESISDTLLQQLVDFLAARPSLAAQVNTSGGDVIPVLPPINAAQVLVAKPEYLEFQNGFGARFISYYSQGLEPITDEAIMYTFIGMTADGKYVVSAKFPVDTSVLSEIDYTTLDYDAFAQNYLPYLDETLATLDGLDAQWYTPDLTLLDNLIKSLKVGA
jgi:hypothetical protein